MNIDHFSDREWNIILQTVRAVQNNDGYDWIDSSEFQTRTGFERYELDAITNDRYSLDVCNIELLQMVSNCLNEVCNTLSIREKQWKNNFDFSLEEVTQVFEKWRKEAFNI